MLEKELMSLSKTLFRYGTIIEDLRNEDTNARYTKILYEGNNFTIFMMNGRVLDIKKEGKKMGCPYLKSYEGIVSHDMDNVCDDVLELETITYCSLTGEKCCGDIIACEVENEF